MYKESIIIPFTKLGLKFDILINFDSPERYEIYLYKDDNEHLINRCLNGKFLVINHFKDLLEMKDVFYSSNGNGELLFVEVYEGFNKVTIKMNEFIYEYTKSYNIDEIKPNVFYEKINFSKDIKNDNFYNTVKDYLFNIDNLKKNIFGKIKRNSIDNLITGDIIKYNHNKYGIIRNSNKNEIELFDIKIFMDFEIQENFRSIIKQDLIENFEFLFNIFDNINEDKDINFTYSKIERNKLLFKDEYKIITKKLVNNHLDELKKIL